jgi:DNA-binding HxlR family transcriptional regulator
MREMKRDLLTDLPCESSCPVAKTSVLIEGKWTTRIIRDLLSGKKRYSQLQRSLTGISPKVLAERLRFLEEQGLITKTIYPVVPPHTEYELTAHGHGLRVIIEAMAQFGLSVQSQTADGKRTI